MKEIKSTKEASLKQDFIAALVFILVVFIVFRVGIGGNDIVAHFMVVPVIFGIVWIIGLYFLRNKKYRLVTSLLISAAVEGTCLLYLASNV